MSRSTNRAGRSPGNGTVTGSRAGIWRTLTREGANPGSLVRSSRNARGFMGLDGTRAHQLDRLETRSWENPDVDWAILVGSLLVILVGAELFTNGVEWVGQGFGLSEGA